MATFDRQRRGIVLRIVYDGPAHAGKTANLRALHASFPHRASGNLYVPEATATGRTLYFDWLELAAGQVDDWQLRCQLLTVPGQFVFAERRYRLLRGVDAAVLVCESTPRGVQTARYARAFLERVLGAAGATRRRAVPVVVQANKQDLAGALAPDEIEALLGLSAGRRVVPASALHGEGVRATFMAALDAAREVVREQLRSGGPEALGPPLESAEHLYATMLREADDAPDSAVAAALDEALACMDERELR